LFAPSGPTVAQLGELGVARVGLGSLLFRAALSAAIDAVTNIRAGRAVDGKLSTYTEVQDLAPVISIEG
jgi:2-methylisocitrate lyase-like PEP mutase family enzyme